MLPQKIDFKTFISKIHFKIAPSKNAFQNCYLKKYTSKLLPQKNSFQNRYLKKIHFKIAPSKKAFQNCYFSSIVIEGIKTLIFFTKRSK